jgi:hypothetical protein
MVPMCAADEKRSKRNSWTNLSPRSNGRSFRGTGATVLSRTIDLPAQSTSLPKPSLMTSPLQNRHRSECITTGEIRNDT